MLGNKENNKQILRYVLPSVSAMIVSFTYNMVDGMFVGQGVGPSALASVNLAMPFTQIMTGIASMLAIGGATAMAIYKGKEDTKRANQVFLTSTLLVIIAGLFITGVGFFASTQIARLFGATELLLGQTATYIKWYSLFSIFFTASILGNAFVRNDGNPELAFWGMIVGALSNIFLDWLFIFPLQMGIKGAAIASGLGQLLSCLVLACHFLRKKGILRIERFSVNVKQCREVIVCGLPEFVIQISQPMTIFCYNLVILHYLGESGLTAFAGVTYMMVIMLGVFFGISQGLQPLIGTSFGRRETHKVNYYFRAGLLINLILSTLLYSIYVLVGPYALKLFITDNTLIPLAYTALKWYGLAYIPAAINIIYITYFLSIRKSGQAFWISCSRGIVLNCLLIFTLPALFGIKLIWLPLLIAESLTLIFAMLLKKRKNTKNIIADRTEDCLKKRMSQDNL